jgi:hypothetical protein
MKLAVVRTASIRTRKRGAADSTVPSWRKRCHVTSSGTAGKTASTTKASMALVVTVPPIAVPLEVSADSPRFYVGQITTTAATSDALSVGFVTTSSHCYFAPTNSAAASLSVSAAGLYIVPTASTVTLNHANANVGAVFNIFCSVL